MKIEFLSHTSDRFIVILTINNTLLGKVVLVPDIKYLKC